MTLAMVVPSRRSRSLVSLVGLSPFVGQIGTSFDLQRPLSDRAERHPAGQLVALCSGEPEGEAPGVVVSAGPGGPGRDARPDAERTLPAGRPPSVLLHYDADHDADGLAKTVRRVAV